MSQAEKHEQAIAECQALLKEYNQPGDVHKIRSVLSAIYSAAHQYDKAEEQLLLILKDDPDDATANNDLGYLWADQNKKLDEAEKLIRKALELDRRQRKSTEHAGAWTATATTPPTSIAWAGCCSARATGRRLAASWRRPVRCRAATTIRWSGTTSATSISASRRSSKAGSAWRKAIELYESGGRRRPDERYREIKEKLQHPGTVVRGAIAVARTVSLAAPARLGLRTTMHL